MLALHADAVEAQCRALLAQARRADERGYCVMVHGMNPAGSEDGFLYNGFAGAFWRWLDARRSAGARRVAVIHVFPTKEGITSGKPFIGKVSFSLELPKTRSWRPICSAIELMSAKRIMVGGSPTVRGTGIFTWRPKSGSHEYSGRGRDAL